MQYCICTYSMLCYGNKMISDCKIKIVMNFLHKPKIVVDNFVQMLLAIYKNMVVNLKLQCNKCFVK